MAQHQSEKECWCHEPEADPPFQAVAINPAAYEQVKGEKVYRGDGCTRGRAPWLGWFLVLLGLAVGLIAIIMSQTIAIAGASETAARLTPSCSLCFSACDFGVFAREESPSTGNG